MLRHTEIYIDTHTKKINVCPNVCIIKRIRTVKCTSKEIKKRKKKKECLLPH